MHGYDDYGCWAGGWGVGMMIVMLVWIILILAATYAIVRRINKMKPPGTGVPNDREGEHGKKALRILEEAYARGEISREEFLRKREDIAGKRG